MKGGVIKEEDTDLFEVASLILRDFVQGHPFVDGNKRIAFELVDILLRDNGYIFTSIVSIPKTQTKFISGFILGI